MRTLETPVAIVGAGPCGMMTALLLAKQGVECELFERHPHISEHPKAMGIARRTAEIYRTLGILDRMVAGGTHLPGESLMVWAKSLAGEEFGRAPITGEHTPFSPCHPFHCPQTHTEKILFEQITAQDSVGLHMGWAVRAVREEGDGVLLEGTGPDGDFTCRARYVVAADGAASGIRSQLGVETFGPGDMGHFLNVFIRADLGKVIKGRESLLYTILHKDFAEFLVTVNGSDLWLMHHFLPPGAEAGDFPPEFLAGAFQMAVGTDPPPEVEILGISPWVMSPKVASRFRVGRIFLTGDAAARLSPAGGLGMNTGLQSAHNLAWKLACVVKGNGSETLLDTYQEERHALVLSVLGHTNTSAESVFEQVELGLKEDFDGLRESIRRSHRQGAGHGFDIGIAYASGAFVADGSPAPALGDPVNDYVPDARPGARLPHLWLQRDGTRISSLDIAPNGFFVLAGKDVPVARDDSLVVFRLADHGAALTPDDDDNPPWRETFGISDSGAILVRPDGYVCWRKASNASIDEARQALAKVLG